MALERLGVGPCYHMVDVTGNLELVSQWRRALDGELALGRDLRRLPLDRRLARLLLLSRADPALSRREGLAQRPRRRVVGAQHARDDLGGALRRHADAPPLRGEGRA